MIYLRRSNSESWPWTQDSIFLKFKFCNVYREQDRVTEWIRNNWITPFSEHPNLWFALCLARMINWPDSLQEIGFPVTWNPNSVLDILQERMTSQKKTFTSAYLLGGGNNLGISKAEYIIRRVLDPVWKEFHRAIGMTVNFNALPSSYPKFAVMDLWAQLGTEPYRTSLQETWQWLCQFHGWGKFLAYEVVTDLRHTRYLCNAPDIMSWANIGPGARRGLNRIYERELRATGQSDEKLLEELLLITSWMLENKDPHILPLWEPRDTEHWLCETDKYHRAVERLKAGKVTGLERYHTPELI